ncbi:hypothetical protein DL96DRAFT_211506 [Flagelloscypha sp. PMI_526]|nr:hypothetical protein DL96DRAFT_211506 [Flagelloscypha sp. PMI_526]
MATVPVTNVGILFNRLLIPSIQPGRERFPCPIVWDVREDPLDSARPVLGRYLTPATLLDKVTEPALPSLSIRCDELPSWSCVVRNPRGITIKDLLSTIHGSLKQNISKGTFQAEFSKAAQRRIEEVHFARCQASTSPLAAQYQGLLWMDCLMNTTLFSGIVLGQGDDFATLVLSVPTYDQILASMRLMP